MYVKIKNISKNYEGKTALEDISFSIEKGEFVTLLGPSGCGKSTLLRAIAGLHNIDNGEMLIDGKDISKLPPRNREVGMVFQSYALFPNLTVYSNIAFGLKMNGTPKEELEERVEKMIRLVHLEGKENSYPRELSGGQQQRVALARSLVMKPKVLLLDEPLSALDAKIRKNLQIELRKIQKDMGMTMVFVTHDQEEAMTMSDKIIVMNHGEIAQIGTPEEIYSTPKSEFVARFIGHYNVLQCEKSNWISKKLGMVGIRPEAISIVDDKEENDVLYALGKIQTFSLKGNIVRYEILVENDTVAVDVLYSQEKKREIGSQVLVKIHPKDVIQLAV